MGIVKLEVEKTDVNVIDAAGRGTGEGLHLALNVGAMLISFLALVALLNAILGLAGLSLQQILGWAFAPVAWAMGVPWHDAPTIGNLLGTRMVLNEFVAYSQLGPLKASLDPQLVHHRHLRAVRVRQLQLDRHPDRRHRRAGAQPAPRPGAARPARDAGRHAGELRDGDDRGVPAVDGRIRNQELSASDRHADPIPRFACPTTIRSPKLPSSSAADRGDPGHRHRARFRPRRLRRPCVEPGCHPLHRHPALAGVDRRRARRKAGSGGGVRQAGGGARRPRALLRGAPADHVDVRDTRARPAGREARHPDQRRGWHQHFVRIRAR